MKRSLDSVIRELRDLLLQMGSRAEAILAKSFRSLEDRDAQLAGQVAADDIEIDRLDVTIDAAVLQALALNAPVSVDLREVVAIKMIANDLERVGDLARNIAKSSVRFAERSETVVPSSLTRLAASARDLLRRSLDAFARGDAEAARAVLADDDRVDAEEEAVILEELGEISGDPQSAPQAVDFIVVAKNLERVGDHATNIAEDVILIVEARNVKHATKLSSVS